MSHATTNSQSLANSIERCMNRTQPMSRLKRSPLFLSGLYLYEKTISFSIGILASSIPFDSAITQVRKYAFHIGSICVAHLNPEDVTGVNALTFFGEKRARYS